jgi:hypothetical protein
VKPGGDAAHLRFREIVGKHLDEQVAPPVVASAHAAQVAVELAARQEIPKGELNDARRAAVGQVLLVGHRVQQSRRHEEPAESQRRGDQRLAGRAGVDDPVRVQCLKGSDGRSLVAVLGVVVVLDLVTESSSSMG